MESSRARWNPFNRVITGTSSGWESDIHEIDRRVVSLRVRYVVYVGRGWSNNTAALSINKACEPGDCERSCRVVSRLFCHPSRANAYLSRPPLCGLRSSSSTLSHALSRVIFSSFSSHFIAFSSRTGRNVTIFLFFLFEIETKRAFLPLASSRLRDFREMSGVNISNAMEYSIPQISGHFINVVCETLDGKHCNHSTRTILISHFSSQLTFSIFMSSILVMKRWLLFV